MPLQKSVICGRLTKQNCALSEKLHDLVSVEVVDEAFLPRAVEVLEACVEEWEKNVNVVANMSSGEKYDQAWQDRNYTGYLYMEKYMAISQAYEYLLARLKGDSFDILNSRLEWAGFFNDVKRRQTLLPKLNDSAEEETNNWLKVVIFDKDGTLIEYNKAYGPWIEYRVDEIASRLSFKKDQVQKMYEFLGYDQQRHKVCGESSFVAWAPNEHIRDVLMTFIKTHLDIGKTPIATIDKTVHDVFKDDTKGLGTISLINSGVSSLFNKLRENGIKVVVMTSDGRNSTEEQLKEHKLFHLVDFLVCGNDPNCRKPHPYGFIRACEVCGCSPDKAIMIGDTRADMLTGKAAGARLVIGVLSGCGTADDLLMDYPPELGTDFLVKEVGPDLLPLLKNFVLR